VSDSNHKRRHHLEEGNSQLELMRGIRKNLPPPTKVFSPKTDKPARINNWKDLLEEYDEGEEGII